MNTYFVTENCMNISGVIDDVKMAQELNELAIIRSRALDVCYSIPHYNELETKTKNAIYDIVKNLLTS